MEIKKNFQIIDVKEAYKPDILTCLANLSNDEVFTPPNLVNDILDLLPAKLFKNKDAKFLDPVCKSGVFLREIAKRLMEGLKKAIPDEDERREHIFKNQLFGIAITELTAQMSRRSVYCSKNANGKYSVVRFNNENGNIKFEKNFHTFKNGNCIYCGASENEYGKNIRKDLESHAYEFIHLSEQEEKEMIDMKFDVIIGNPPYQLSDGGAQASAKPIYHKFVEQAKKLNPRYLTMIIPSRWFSGGKGLDDFRKNMLVDSRIRELHDFINANDCFAGVDIKGGVCYFLWDRENKGKCKVINHESDRIVDTDTRFLLNSCVDIFIRQNKAVPILEKILSMTDKSFSTIVSSRKPFGLGTNFMDFGNTGTIKVFSFHTKNAYLSENFSFSKGQEWVKKWKVFVPKAVGIGNMKFDIIKSFIGCPNTVATETYLVVGPFKDEKTCVNVQSYINTKFFHFLLGLKKVTQDTTQSVYSLIPMQNFEENWTDEKLYKKYCLTNDEINYIEMSVHTNKNELKIDKEDSKNNE